MLLLLPLLNYTFVNSLIIMLFTCGDLLTRGCQILFQVVPNFLKDNTSFYFFMTENLLKLKYKWPYCSSIFHLPALVLVPRSNDIPPGRHYIPTFSLSKHQLLTPTVLIRTTLNPTVISIVL